MAVGLTVTCRASRPRLYVTGGGSVIVTVLVMVVVLKKKRKNLG
jgi:hypothetical protein